jgi:hypothetical protein
MINIKELLKKIPFVKKILNERNKKMVEHLKKGEPLLKNTSLQTVNSMIAHLKKGESLLKNADQKTRDHWKPRIELVQESSDNSKINYVHKAGTFNENDNFIMHNGILISPLSYYNFPMLELLFLNNGVHEPQEEYVFQEVLKYIPDGAVMLELGAYWSFYSMWFNSEISKANNYLIEPEDINSGITNFELNKMKGDFTKAYISDKSSDTINGTATVCVDDFIDEKSIEFIDVLHSDIQGYEFKMLMGAEKVLDGKQVGYIFISTHSNELHYQCMKHLELKGYELVCSYDMDESFSWDGLIVFKNPDYEGVNTIDVSKRKLN